jgi:hypothetical protein
MPTIVWTQLELDTLKAAIASGILTVVYDGPPRRSVTYQSLSEMRDLLADMAGSIAATTSGTTYRLASTRKGL